MIGFGIDHIAARIDSLLSEHKTASVQHPGMTYTASVHAGRMLAIGLAELRKDIEDAIARSLAEMRQELEHAIERERMPVGILFDPQIDIDLDGYAIATDEDAESVEIIDLWYQIASRA